MSELELLIAALEFNRGRTLDLLTKYEAVDGALAWRPGPDRAHAAWQFMHVAVTEELFATERLNPERKTIYPGLLPRFRGGSTPDDQIPSAAELREVLAASRVRLLETVRALPAEDLNHIPPAMAARGLTLREILRLISWHEAHHQGQAHLTFNLYQASRG